MTRFDRTAIGNLWRVPIAGLSALILYPLVGIRFRSGDGVFHLYLSRSNPTSVPDAEQLLSDFAECNDALQRAKAEGSKWHFAMDI